MSEYIEYNNNPYIKIRSKVDKHNTDREHDAMYYIPKGWNIAFGKLLEQELWEAAIESNIQEEFIIESVKEKDGALSINPNMCPKNIEILLAKYKEISRHICIECGKPDVPCLDLPKKRPYCKDCFEKAKNELNYEQLIIGSEQLPNRLQYNDGWADIDIDISESVNEIRSNYAVRTGNQ